MTKRTTHTNHETGANAYANYETHAAGCPSLAYPALRIGGNDFVMVAGQDEFVAHVLGQMDAYAILSTGGFND